jgi:hypothetical protein
MNKTILETVLREQARSSACESKPFVEFFKELKKSEQFENLVLAAITSIVQFPLSPETVMRVCLGYALYSGAAYAKAEREVRELEEIT